MFSVDKLFSLFLSFFKIQNYLPDPWVCKAPKCMFVSLFVFPEPVILLKMHATADQKNERLKMGIAEKKAVCGSRPPAQLTASLTQIAVNHEHCLRGCVICGF
jgi:hypothetical protein